MPDKNELARRLFELERECAEQREALQFLADKLEVKLPNTGRNTKGQRHLWELNDEERNLALNNKPIKAIKKYRKRTGAGLTEGKFVVDDAIKRHDKKKDK